jgi:uncharacterized membrane protein
MLPFIAGIVFGATCSSLILWFGGWRDLRKAAKQFQETEKRHVAALADYESFQRERQKRGAAMARLADTKNSKDLKS